MDFSWANNVLHDGLVHTREGTSARRTFKPFLRKFLSKMVLFATKTTCRLENFFSNSRINLPWIFFTFFHTRNGKYTITAFCAPLSDPDLTSTSLAEENTISRRSCFTSL